MLWILGIIGGICAFLFLAYLVIGALWTGIIYVPKPEAENIFDEIYGSSGRNNGDDTVPPCSRFFLSNVFDGEYEDEGLLCDGSSYPARQRGDRIYICVDERERTISFIYRYGLTAELPNASSVYTYSFPKKTLTYTTTHPSEPEPNPFLWDFLLPKWLDNTGGMSDYSYTDYGEYNYVTGG